MLQVLFSFPWLDREDALSLAPSSSSLPTYSPTGRQPPLDYSAFFFFFTFKD